MQDLSHLYSLLLALSAILSAFAWGIVQRRRDRPGSGDLLVFLSGTLIWSLAYALHWSSVMPGSRYFWLNMTYIGVTITPPSMFLFILEITQSERPLTRYKRLALYIVPALTLFLLATDPIWGLFYGGKQAIGQSRIYDGGPGFWMNLASIWLRWRQQACLNWIPSLGWI
jgi:hypothetical protein